jgi:hypothetical protein
VTAATDTSRTSSSAAIQALHREQADGQAEREPVGAQAQVAASGGFQLIDIPRCS